MLKSVVEPLLYDLDTLKGVQPNLKLRVLDNRLAVDNRYFQTISRMASGDGRDNVYSHLNRVCSQLEDVLESYSHNHAFEHVSVNPKILEFMGKHEKNMVGGINYFTKQIAIRKKEVEQSFVILEGHYGNDLDFTNKLKSLCTKFSRVFEKAQRLDDVKIETKALNQVIQPHCTHLTQTLSSEQILHFLSSRDRSLASALVPPHKCDDKHNHDESQDGDQNDIVGTESHFLLQDSSCVDNSSNLVKIEDEKEN